jgi:hypothetical protein
MAWLSFAPYSTEQLIVAPLLKEILLLYESHIFVTTFTDSIIGLF